MQDGKTFLWYYWVDIWYLNICRELSYFFIRSITLVKSYSVNTHDKIWSEIKNRKINQQTFFCKNNIANWIAASWSCADKNVLLLSIKVPLNMSRYFCRMLYFLLAEAIFCTIIKLIESYSKCISLHCRQVNFNKPKY